MFKQYLILDFDSWHSTLTGAGKEEALTDEQAARYVAMRDSSRAQHIKNDRPHNVGIFVFYLCLGELSPPLKKLPLLKSVMSATSNLDMTLRTKDFHSHAKSVFFIRREPKVLFTRGLCVFVLLLHRPQTRNLWRAFTQPRPGIQAVS